MSLESERRSLESERNAIKAERRTMVLTKEALESREKQFEMDMKQREEQFQMDIKQREEQFEAKMRQAQADLEAKTKQQQGELEAKTKQMEEQFQSREEQFKQQFLLPDPTTSLLLSSAAVDGTNSGHVNHNIVDMIQSQQLKQEQSLVNNNNNNQQINQLKKIASMTQNRYDDTLRLLDQIKKEREALESERIEFATTIESEKEALEQRRVEIQNTRLNIPADTTTVPQLITTITDRSSRISTLQSYGMNDEQMLLSFITMSNDEFDELANPQNLSRLQDFIRFTLTPSQRQHIFGLSNDEYNDLKGRIPFFQWSSAQTIVSPGLNHGCKMVISDDKPFFQTQKEFISSELYRVFTTSTVGTVITTCNTNFAEWGMLEKDTKIEFKFIPINMNCHYSPRCFSSLLGVLYPMNGSTPVTGNASVHIHPKDPSIMQRRSAIFNSYYTPLVVNGKIPSLSTNPRLYFSTPHIANGDWIQFHGPGTDIFDVGGDDFYLTLGALCPKGKERLFTSQETYYRSGDHADKPTGRDTGPSEYQISIKWD